jgi:hypothetical protein
LCSKDTDFDDAAREQQATYRSAIQYAREYLSGRLHDVLAQRGVLLIDSLFPDGPSSEAVTPSAKDNNGSNIRFDDVVSAFTAGWAMFGIHSDLQRGGTTAGSVGHSGSVGSGPGSLGVPSPGMVGRYGPPPPSGPQILPPLPPQPYVPGVGVLQGMGVPGVHATDYGHAQHTRHAQHKHQGHPQQSFPETMSPNLEDFDAWFQHIFATGHGTTFE